MFDFMQTKIIDEFICKYKMGNNQHKEGQKEIFSDRAINTNMNKSLAEVKQEQDLPKQLNKNEKKKIHQMCEMMHRKQKSTNIDLVEHIYHLTEDRKNIKIGDEGAKYISQQKWNLFKLDLNSQQISHIGANYLRKAQWKQLTVLSLWKNNIGNQGMLHLTRSNWANIRQFYISNNQITADGAKSLSLANWTELRKLDMGNNHLGSEGIKFISQTKWTNILELNLKNNYMSSRGVKYLIQKLDQTQSFRLKYLFFKKGSNRISSQGVIDLINSNWPELSILLLVYNNLNREAMLYLILGDWKHLNLLRLDHNKQKQDENKSFIQTSLQSRFGKNCIFL